jgi:hypothetical protein
MLDQHQDAERGAREAGTALYRRPMPGGGYVEVELYGDAGLANGESTPRSHRGRVVMERRADPGRRDGHQAPVLAELTGDDRDELMSELFRLAQDNAALARSLLRLQAEQHRAD